LNQCLAEFAPDWQQAFQTYHAKRKEHVDTLADLCILNFLEMRAHVGSRIFVLKKKLDILLHILFPGWYLPLYTMITFTRIPYAAALKRAKMQQRIVRGALATLGVIFCLILFYWLRN